MRSRGHDGGVPTGLTTPMLLNRDANSWTEQIATDHAKAVVNAFCGERVSARAARPLAAALRRMR